jgi:hypothetical protein
MVNNDIKNNSKLTALDALMTGGQAGRFAYQARTEQDHANDE